MLLFNRNRATVVTEIAAPAPEPQEPLIECFDVAHYRAQLTAAGVAIPDEVDLIDFYKQTPEARLFSPNNVFDENYYLSHYDDVREAVRSGDMLSGFAHFVLNGAQEGRFPNRDFEIEVRNGVILGKLCKEDEFEQEFYLTEYNVAKHFVKGFPIFTAYKFFTAYGRSMGHVPQRAQKISFESVHSYRLGTHSPRLESEHVELIRPHFDASFYERQYADEIAGSPPLAHYLRSGQNEGKSPNSWFDEAFYRAFYAEVAKEIPSKLSSGFEHYLRAGRREGCTRRCNSRPRSGGITRSRVAE
jgi:O-antigen biosynthesis protein